MQKIIQHFMILWLTVVPMVNALRSYQVHPTTKILIIKLSRNVRTELHETGTRRLLNYNFMNIKKKSVAAKDIATWQYTKC